MPASNNRGQSLVEFAFVISLLLFITIISLRLGLAIYTSLAMNNAADAAAFQASLGRSESEVQAYIHQELQDKRVNPNDVAIVVQCSPIPCGYGSLVTIAMTKTDSINALWWQVDLPLTAQAGAIVQKEP